MTNKEVLEDAVRRCNSILARWEREEPAFLGGNFSFSMQGYNNVKSLLLTCLYEAIRKHTDWREWGRLTRVEKPIISLKNNRVSGLFFGIHRGNTGWADASRLLDYEALSDVPIVGTDQFTLEDIKFIKYTP